MESQYLQAVDRVIAAGDHLVDCLSSNVEKRTYALSMLVRSIDELQKHALGWPEFGSVYEQSFVRALVEMQAGCLQVSAGRAIESGDRSPIRAALSKLRGERADEDAARVAALFFDKDLLEFSSESDNDQSALAVFKSRAARTVDNMVEEARDVISTAAEKFKDAFPGFSKELGELSNSFAAQGGNSIVKAGVDKIISGLKMFAEILHSELLQTAIDDLEEVIKESKLKLDFKSVLGKAFRAANTQHAIDKLELRPKLNQTMLKTAETQMAELSRRYVLLLKRARWVLLALATVGSMLVLVGAAALYAAMTMPIAYAVVAVAVVLIGMHFADVELNKLISSLS